MIAALRTHEIDIGIGLTEGWVAGLVGKDRLQKGHPDGGYKIVGQWVETPLRWAIVTGNGRDDVDSVDDLEGRRAGVSRMGRYVSLNHTRPSSSGLDSPGIFFYTAAPTLCHMSFPSNRNGACLPNPSS
jgi:hypothetical protein